MSRPTIETKQPAMPETPRTDAETSKGRIWLDGWYGELGEYVPAEIARQLERELKEALSSRMTHTDHPLRHYDRTCPAYVVASSETAPIKSDPVDDLCKYIKESIRLCDHGYIHITCGDCNHVGNR